MLNFKTLSRKNKLPQWVQLIFVFETENVSNFNEFFDKHFDTLDGENSFEKFENVISKLEIDDDEILERINEFIKLGQFDNAKFYAEKIENDYESHQQIEKINIHKDYIFKNKIPIHIHGHIHEPYVKKMINDTTEYSILGYEIIKIS